MSRYEICRGAVWLCAFNTQLTSLASVRHSQRHRRTQRQGWFYSAPDGGAEYCDERVCVSVCVCPRSYLQNYTSELYEFFVHVTYGRGSVLFWHRSDKLCTSGFLDDVMSAHKSRLLDVAAQLKRSAHAALGLAINCAQ